MNTEEPKSLEVALDEALTMRADGKALPEILALFPEHQDELTVLLHAAEVLSMAAQSVTPVQSSLRDILTHIPTEPIPVTPAPSIRNLSRSNEKGRTHIGLLISQIYDPMKWKIIVPLVVVVIIAVITYTQLGSVSPKQEGVAVAPSNTGGNNQPGEMKGAEKTPTTAAPVNPGPRDAVVDPAVDAIVAAAAADASLTGEEDSDAALISMDSQAIGDIGQAYSNNEL